MREAKGTIALPQLGDAPGVLSAGVDNVLQVLMHPLTHTRTCMYVCLQAAAELSRVAPIELLRPSLEPWRGGLLSLDDVIAKLRELLPPTFEELQREFAVGVVTAEGEHLLIDSGPLPEAVAASAAIPFVFASVDVPGEAAAGCGQ